MSFPRHAQYKKVNKSWFHEIPLGWETAQIKWLSPVKRGASPRPIDDPVYFDDKGEYGWVRISDVTSSKGILLHTEQKLSETGSSLSVKLGPGELFLSIAGSVGKPCFSGIKCCIHDGFVYFPGLSINPHFLYWIFESRKCFGGLGKLGTQLNLNTDIVGSISIPFPTCTNEIEEIISFLDREIAKLDALLSEQQRLVEIFKLKLSSLALSGFQDEKPNYQRIGNITHIVSRPANIKVDEEYEPLGLLNRGRGIFHKEPRRGAEMGDSDFFYVEAGDLILSGQFAWEGSIAVVGKSESGCVVSHRYPIIQGDNKNCLTEFLLALLWTDHGNFLLNQCSRGAAGRNRPLNLGLLLKEEIALPCPTVQREIQEEYRKYIDLKNEQVRQAELVLERRSALITAAVTGQIDVRSLIAEEEAA